MPPQGATRESVRVWQEGHTGQGLGPSLQLHASRGYSELDPGDSDDEALCSDHLGGEGTSHPERGLPFALGSSISPAPEGLRGPRAWASRVYT